MNHNILNKIIEKIDTQTYLDQYYVYHWHNHFKGVDISETAWGIVIEEKDMYRKIVEKHPRIRYYLEEKFNYNGSIEEESIKKLLDRCIGKFQIYKLERLIINPRK